MITLWLPTLLLIGLPAALFIVFGMMWLAGYTPKERVLSRTTVAVHAMLTVLVGWLTFELLHDGRSSVIVTLGTWFAFEEVSIPFSFLIDPLSLTMAALTVVLTGLVAAFSVRYMHRDQGYLRFFLLLHLFTFGALVVFLSSTLDLMFGGWELVGLSSVLLVGYFQYRKEPLRNAVKVFAAYRLADLQIVLATVFGHLWLGGASWANLLRGVANGHVEAPDAAFSNLAVLLIIGACGKSAQGPFFGWLARAMEGPTPSSAIFYGAISVHAGTYLLLRVQPMIAASGTATALLIAIGAGTAIVSTIVQRTRPDAKTSLAYAVQTQIGLIMVEIALGWTTLALVHIVGHALLRTMQFLRAPSLLHDHHTMHAAAGGHLITPDPLYSALPNGPKLALYRIGIGQGYYDALIDRISWRPTLGTARSLAWLSPRITAVSMGLLAAIALSFGAAQLSDVAHVPSVGLVISALGCLLSILTAMRAFAERRPRRVVGMVLLSVMGMVLAGLSSGEPKGVIGGMLVGIMLVFAAFGITAVLRALEARTDLALDPRDHLGLGARAPRLSLLFLVFSLALVGIPGTLGFVAEDLLFHGALHRMPVLGIALPLATALNAIHLLRTWHLLFNGRPAKDTAAIPDALPRERWPLLAFVLILIVLGLLPDMLIERVGPVAELLAELLSPSH